MREINLEEITKIIEPVVISEGYELVDIEFKRDQVAWVLRLYIDKAGGVTVDDCAQISREIYNLLEVEDAVSLNFSLEVSSPGLNRRLRKQEHFLKVIGCRVKVKTHEPVDGARNFKAELIEVTDDSILVDNGVKRSWITLDNIEKANLIYKF